MATSISQFKNILENDVARALVGVNLSRSDALWIAGDNDRLTAYFNKWNLDQRDNGNVLVQTPAITPEIKPPTPSVAPSLPYATPLPLPLPQPQPAATGGGAGGFVMSLVALVFVALPLLSLPLGILGLIFSRRFQKRALIGARGRRLATAGVILGISAISLTTLIMLLAIPGALVHNFGPQLTAQSDLSEGDCLTEPFSSLPASVETVDCTESHLSEVYFVGDVPGDEWPGDESVSSYSDSKCVTAFADYVGVSYEDSALEVLQLFPAVTNWDAGDHAIACMAYWPDGDGDEVATDTTVRNSGL